MPAAFATSDSPGRNGDSPSSGGWAPADRLLLAGLLGLTALRSLAVFLSPLELGVDEAQYWLWSQHFDFGYFTKPPLTSWIIGASHAIFGHHSWAVRLPAAWMHLATALVLWRTASWLGGAQAGRLAALLWVTLPAVGLGGFLISTDTPLLLFWSLSLMALTAVRQRHIDPVRGMLLAGGALGAAMLAKYAAIYGLLGLLLFFGFERFLHRERIITPSGLIMFALGMVIVASPNLLWNLSHDFTTVRHLGDNANLDRQSYSIGNSLGFLAAQFLTAGPVIFALMLGVLRLRRNDPDGGFFFAFSVPPLLVISIQAFLSEANANWALAAMPALVIWVACWAAPGHAHHHAQHHARHHARRRYGIMLAGIMVNAVLAGVILAICLSGTMGPLTPESDPLRRLRGWQALAADTALAARDHRATAVIADSRASAALLHWHFHETDGAGGPITILVHDADGMPSNHFEANHAWQPMAGRRLLMLFAKASPPPISGIEWAGSPAMSDTRISQNRRRSLYIFSGIETGN